jgi:thiamine biosynthesis lipoprotein
MASALRLQVHGAPAAAAEAGWAGVVEGFAAAEGALSRFRDESDLTHLNRTAGSGTVVLTGEHLYRAISAADRARRVTDGRFDARVLVDLERLGDPGAPLPPGPVAAAPGSAGLVRRPRERVLGLDRPYDLGGIGKGLALRWAWRRLAPLRAVASGVLLEAGGDLVAGGTPVGEPAWSVGIEDPRGGDEPLGVIAVRDGAVCTSSVARRVWHAPDGRPVHHLIDPRSGEPGGDGLLSVTVAGPDPAWAEVWSKALFLAGSRAIGDLARARGLAAWWVELNGTLRMTPAARPRTAWLAE